MQNTAIAEQETQKVMDTRPLLTRRWRALEAKGWEFNSFRETQNTIFFSAKKGRIKDGGVYQIPWSELQESTALMEIEYQERITQSY